MSIPIVLRPPNQKDIDFIYDSWLHSYKDSPFCPIPGNSYWYYQKMLITHILNKSLLTVICNPEDEEQIYGYAVYQVKADQLILHWLYIKYTFRLLGLARTVLAQLLNDGDKSRQLIITHKGIDYPNIKDRYPHKWIPKLAFT